MMRACPPEANDCGSSLVQELIARGTRHGVRDSIIQGLDQTEEEYGKA